MIVIWNWYKMQCYTSLLAGCFCVSNVSNVSRRTTTCSIMCCNRITASANCSFASDSISRDRFPPLLLLPPAPLMLLLLVGYCSELSGPINKSNVKKICN